MGFPPRERPLGPFDKLVLRVRFFLNRRDIDAARRIAESASPGRDLRKILSVYARAVPANTNAISDLVFFVESFERTAGLKASDVLGLAPGEALDKEGELALAILRAVAAAMHKGDREALDKGPGLVSSLVGRAMSPEELSGWLQGF